MTVKKSEMDYRKAIRLDLFLKPKRPGRERCFGVTEVRLSFWTCASV